jgi:hypothetical protein
LCFYQQARNVLQPYAPLQVLGLALALVPLVQAARNTHSSNTQQAATAATHKPMSWLHEYSVSYGSG